MSGVAHEEIDREVDDGVCVFLAALSARTRSLDVGEPSAARSTSGSRD